MPKHKLTKKHRTFDCDLNDLEYERKPRLDLLLNNNNDQSQLLMTNNNDDLGRPLLTSADTGGDTKPLNPQHLSKMTLSSSLQQLTENSKYLINAQPNQNTNTNNNQLSNRTNANQRKQQEANVDTVHVVVGNEACDLDSTVSCLLLFHIISKMSDEINGKDKGRTLYIPLLNITRDTLDSKHEVLWFLEKTLSIDKSFLTCKDDIDWTDIKKNGIDVLVTLVDHNFNEEFNEIGKIVEIIDHHQIQNPSWLVEKHSSIRLTLDTSVGSCTTLIAERLFYIYAEHHVPDEILLLIYGTVLLDTINLNEKAKRFTRRDVYLLQKLDSLLGNKRPQRDELYKQLVEVKNTIRELNFVKLMKRDLKVYKDKHGKRIGIASLFGMEAKEALGLASQNSDLDLFFRQNGYEAFVIMGLIANSEHSDSISRDLVLISANESLFGQLCKAFEQDTSKLDLVPISSDSSPDPEDNNMIISYHAAKPQRKPALGEVAPEAAGNHSVAAASSATYKVRIWLQRNVTSSRKVVAPLVLKVLHDWA